MATCKSATIEAYFKFHSIYLCNQRLSKAKKQGFHNWETPHFILSREVLSKVFLSDNGIDSNPATEFYKLSTSISFYICNLLALKT